MLSEDLHKLKVLPLDRWMQITDKRSETLLKAYTEILPIFRRNGRYLLRGRAPFTAMAWFEINGKAFTVSNDLEKLVEKFESDLKLMNHRPLRDVERAAIAQLVSSKFASKELVDLYNLDRLWISCRKYSRQSLTLSKLLKFARERTK